MQHICHIPGIARPAKERDRRWHAYFRVAHHRLASLAAGFALPAYKRLDARLAYHLARHYTLAVNVKNLTDARYYDTDGSYVIRPGAPRSILASLRAEF